MLQIGKAMIVVNNVENYAKEDPYWVVRICEGEAWFYSAWDDEKKAQRAASEIGGVVVENKEVRP